MKLNKITLAFLGMATLAVTSCTDDPEYNAAAPIANPAQVYFSNTNADQTVEVGDDQTEFSVPLYRADKNGALTVNVTAVNPDADIFSIPSTVTFADGEETTDIVVTYDPEKLAMQTDYNFIFKVEGESTAYYLTEAKLTLNYITWTTLGNATYTDGFVGTFFSVSPVPYEVEIQENPGMPGLYRLVNPYGAAYPYNEPGDYDDTQDYYMYFNCVNPAKVFMCDKKGEPVKFFYSGMNWDYGEFIFCTYAGYLLATGKPADGYYGQLKNGNITFPEKNSLLAAMADYNNGGLYYSSKYEDFRIILPGYDIDLPVDTWESLGDGKWTDGFICPMYGISPAATYEVEVQESQDNPGLYRLINPYTDAFPYGQPADQDYYIVIDARNPECVGIAPQKTGFVDEADGMTVIANVGGYYMANGKSADEVIAKGLNDVMENGIITISGDNALCNWPDADEASTGTKPGSFYSAKDPADAVLELPSAANTSSYSLSVRRSPLETIVKARKGNAKFESEFKSTSVRLEKK